MDFFSRIFKKAKDEAKKEPGKEQETPKETIENRGKQSTEKSFIPSFNFDTDSSSIYPSSTSTATNSKDHPPPSPLPSPPTSPPKRKYIERELARELASPHLLPSSPVSSAFVKTFDCVAFIIHCPLHGKLALATSPTGAIWLPYVGKSSKLPWYTTAAKGVGHILAQGNASMYETFTHSPPYDQLLLLDYIRVQLVSTLKLVERLTFYVRLKQVHPPAKDEAIYKMQSMFNCCTDSASLVWHDIAFIASGSIRNCWGQEPVDFARQIIQAIKEVERPPNDSEMARPSALVLKQKFDEHGVEQMSHYLPTSSGTKATESSYGKSLKSIKTVDSYQIGRLYSDYLDHTYPSLSITYDSFKVYMLKNKFETDNSKLRRLFRTFNSRRNGFLSFKELLLGLIAIERNTPHAEFRIKFLFDYYATTGRGYLFEEDFRKMVCDLNETGGQSLPKEKVASLTREAMSNFKALSIKGRPAVPFASFLKTIGSRSFRGTSGLCRAKRNVFMNITRRLNLRTIRAAGKGTLAQVISKKNYNGSCQSCKNRKYRVLGHLVIIEPSGYCSKQVESLCLPKSVNKTADDSSQFTFAIETPFSDLYNSVPFTLLSRIRQFNESKQRDFTGINGMEGFMSKESERGQLLEILEQLEKQLIPILEGEARCKPVTSQNCFIIGDIHGNLEDLISIEKSIWKRFPEVNGMHYLFLGDIVDRGRWSFECTLYLLSMKLLRPGNVTILRGNHEERQLQTSYTYEKECKAKYGETIGATIWDITNGLFDSFPVCAVVGDPANIYCAHGGIPYSARTIEEINQTVPPYLPDPELDCRVAWEIMWSDPLKPHELLEVQTATPDAEFAKWLGPAPLREGFYPNCHRYAAYIFTEKAVDTFLEENKLSKIIRAHEVPRHVYGYEGLYDYKCTTLFSCSHYNVGFENEAAVILVDGASMRIIGIDTEDNIMVTIPR